MRCLSMVVTVMLILVGGARASFGQPVVMGPHAGIACDTCHVLGPDGEPVSPVRLVDSQELLCGASCHDPALSLPHGNHPMGVVPRYPLTAGFPLDEQGRMTCGTCHRVHATMPGLLRGDGGSDLCSACHTN